LKSLQGSKMNGFSFQSSGISGPRKACRDNNY